MSLSPPGTLRLDNEETVRLIQDASLSYGARHMTPPGSPTSRFSSRSGGDQPPPIQALATEDSVEIIRTESTNAQVLSDDDEDDDDDVLPGAAEGTIAHLTRRLRCLFSAITWPIVPLGTLVSFALLWVLYASFVLDLHRSCSHPLHWYAVASLLVVSYAPQHHKVRAHIFHYSRERDGPVRPPGVRMYDQLFHTLCIIYVYGGVTLIQTCRQDMGNQGAEDDFSKATELPLPATDDTTTGSGSSQDRNSIESSSDDVNTCSATCPHLFDAMVVYVTTLELFTFALILPLLFLPCIYLWILRRATAEADAFSQFQDRIEEEEALLSNGGVATQELMDSLEPVKLVSKGGDSVDASVSLIPARDGPSSWVKDGSNVKECCICMSEFVLIGEADLESGPAGAFASEEQTCNSEGMYSATNPSMRQPTETGAIPAVDENAMVRTKCGHVFHQKCLAGWIGGRWEPRPQQTSPGEESRSERRRRRARRTCCPLCRQDLKPVGNAAASSYSAV